ncbi:hypothetical protein VTI28DRAFT_5835 [Corynascus sepedonium]
MADNDLYNFIKIYQQASYNDYLTTIIQKTPPIVSLTNKNGEFPWLLDSPLKYQVTVLRGDILILEANNAPLVTLNQELVKEQRRLKKHFGEAKLLSIKDIEN